MNSDPDPAPVALLPETSAPGAPTLKVSISATNPCHLYDMAMALHAKGALGRYYSGYPAWKLRPPAGMSVVTRSGRTLVTYGLLKLHGLIRPAPHRLFQWQDRGFDRQVAQALSRDDATVIHAMPGQALETFRAARARGMRTVLNHASGPVRRQLDAVADEYRRAGVAIEKHHGFDDRYFARETAEYAAADRHCVASSIVRRQLIAEGIPDDRIWTVPYGADTRIFHPPGEHEDRDSGHIVYAGQITIRKGLRVAFAAMRALRGSMKATLTLYGHINDDMRDSIAAVSAEPWLVRHGAVDRTSLAAVFRRASLLVLPSWEEAFGLVVVQALDCGLPCVVSDRVGAADLIEHRRNGSVFPAGDDEALAREIAWWLEHPAAFASRTFNWEESAIRLLARTAELE